MKVSNMRGTSGKEVPNQFIIEGWDSYHDCPMTTFQSYKSVIVEKSVDGGIALDERYWDYSKTTGKYRNLFLGETKKETQAKIDAGIYKLANLNE